MSDARSESPDSCTCPTGPRPSRVQSHFLACPAGNEESDRARFGEWVQEADCDIDTGVLPDESVLGYPNLHAAALDWCFPPGESYEDAWLERVFELRQFVRAQPCTCPPGAPYEETPCARCRLLNDHGAGR